MNTKVTIYTTEICPYCVKAKLLLNKKNISFREVKITNDEVLEEMVTKSGGKKTVPQIFINQTHIGGCDDLYQLDRNKTLDELLK